MTLTPAAILTTLLVACTVSAQVADDAIARLGSADNRTRSQAFKELRADKAPATLVRLSQVLPGYPYHSQGFGLALVQKFGRDRCEPVLRGFLRGKPSYLRLAAAVQIYQWGDRSVDVHIAECLRAEVSQEELSGMLTRVYHINNERVLSAVQGCLLPSRPINVLDPALRTLQRFKVTAAIPRVEEVLKDPGLAAEPRALCVAFLVGMGVSSHSATCAKAIAEIKNLSGVLTLLRDAAHLEEVVLAAILEFAEGKKGANVRQVLELLAKHNYRPAVPAIREMLESDNEQISKAAFGALMRIADGLDVKQLRRMITDSSDTVTLAAADALRRMDDSSGLTRVIELTKAKGRIRLEAFNVLGRYRDRRVVPVLLLALQDPDRNVYTRAFRGIQTVFKARFPYRKFDFSQRGYVLGPSPIQRRGVAEQLRAWWQDHDRKK